MAALGTYVVLEIDGDVIAETTNVNFKVESDPLDTTTKDNGLNSSFMAGKLKIGLSGAFLLATSANNWDVLFSLLNAGSQMDVDVYYNGVVIMTGFGVMRKLEAGGGLSDTLATGRYGIRYYVSSLGVEIQIITEGGLTIITEGGEILITE